MLHKVVFLDRDGVINRDSPDYIKSCQEFEFLPRSLDAIRYLTDYEFHVIVITNQSAIGRKMISPQELQNIFALMTSAVESAGGKIQDIFYCPHVPDDACDCRKPRTGLIQMARRKYGIDLSRSYMVGDSVKDIECAKRAGCHSAVLVQTGNGRIARRILQEKKMLPDYIASDLYDAACWISEDHKRFE